MKKMILMATALLFGAVMAANATIVFTTDFEGLGNTDDNTIATYDKSPPSPTGWVVANQGYKSGNQGANLIGSNDVWSFRYTNSGMTTDTGVIGALTAGLTYAVTFDVAQDNGGASPINIALVTFNGAARNDVRSNTGATSTLATLGGNASSSALETKVLSYTADGTEGTLGQDVAIRIFGATTSANYDNFSVDVIPEPATMSLLGIFGLAALVRRFRRG